MANTRFFLNLALLSVLLIVAACSGIKSDYAPPARHLSEAELGLKPKICTDCHTPDDKVVYQRFVHTADFGTDHRYQAYQGEAICSMCHQTSFCNDCHATRIELKPSLKRQTETYRTLPHRGDYLSRHRIDGRVDPTSCFRCHGNPKAAATCSRCHG